jgi:hypothetical protein
MNIVTKYRNRKIGDETKRKRKADIEFSENPHTKKERQRVENITETERIIE